MPNMLWIKPPSACSLTISQRVDHRQHCQQVLLPEPQARVIVLLATIPRPPKPITL